MSDNKLQRWNFNSTHKGASVVFDVDGHGTVHPQIRSVVHPQSTSLAGGSEDWGTDLLYRVIIVRVVPPVRLCYHVVA